jgi:hypothetical protein
MPFDNIVLHYYEADSPTNAFMLKAAPSRAIIIVAPKGVQHQ